uniref:Uncharacterized protein n=1 Tax=Oryctolagus cuniculus TaxID=9986 RepID=A0A5F9C3C1_RABIT
EWPFSRSWLESALSHVHQTILTRPHLLCSQYLSPIEDDHGNSNSSRAKSFLPKKLLVCLLKCSSLPKQRHCWNTNERS